MGPDNFDPNLEEMKLWWSAYDDRSWAGDEIIGQKREWTPTQLPRSVAASANVNPLDDLIVVSATATMTLETAVGCGGRRHSFIFTGATGTLTIACTGSQTVGGSATKATSARYSGINVISDGTNWQIIRSDPAAMLQFPLMNWGGKAFDGSTDYLDTNALTGIADGKKFTWVGILRHSGAAATSEAYHASTGGKFQVRRTTTGNIEVVAENAANAQILKQTSSGNPCAAAGTYIIFVSADLATAGSFRLYINGVAATVTSTTFTNDTIDFTTTEHSIGASTAGASFFAGDGYVIWFDATTNLEFNTESVRRKFVSADGVPVYLGANGELPTGTAPILFLGYDPYTAWPRNRGSAAPGFTVNGTPAAVTTALYGQYAPLEDLSIPVTVTADYTVLATDETIINNRAATNTLTLPSALTCKGRKLTILTIQAQTVVSASSNVVPIIGGAAGTAILAAVDGAWARLEANIDGTWQIIAS